MQLEDAVDQDRGFAAELESALVEAEKSGSAAGGPVVSGNATAGGAWIAIGAVGRDANFGPPPDPRGPDRAWSTPRPELRPLSTSLHR